MNANPDPELEARLDRELKSLPLLPAPSTLAPRVMAVIAARAAAPWYRRPWPVWPGPLRVASLAAALAVFVALCVAGAQAMSAPVLAATRVAGWFEALSALWRTAGLLWAATTLALRSLGPAFLIGAGALLLVCYALCLGLGTISVRLAGARR